MNTILKVLLAVLLVVLIVFFALACYWMLASFSVSGPGALNVIVWDGVA
uniref:Uncharacterized protein n=1 Tax=Dulem virus 113 TaxID=3145590 RepID=A0AAU8BAS4_9VIRU